MEEMSLQHAHQNQLLLKSYSCAECILLQTPDSFLAALRAGKTVTWRDCLKEYNSAALTALGLFALSALLLALVHLVGIYANFSPYYLLAVPIGAVIFIAAFQPELTNCQRKAKKLNVLWQEGKLLVSRQVKIDKPISAEAQCSLHYVFETPDGQQITERRDCYAPLSRRARLQPVMLMLYKSPQEYLVL